MAQNPEWGYPVKTEFIKCVQNYFANHYSKLISSKSDVDIKIRMADFDWS